VHIAPDLHSCTKHHLSHLSACIIFSVLINI